MKKSLKITLIVIISLIGIIALDTFQAKVFNNSPILKIRDNLDGGATDYIDKGLFVNHYKCNNKEETTLFKTVKYACPVSNNSKKVAIEEPNSSTIISLSLEPSEFILNLFNKYKFSPKNENTTVSYNLIIEDISYGIEIYYEISSYQVHITTTEKEIILNQEDSLELLKIINSSVSESAKPIINCLKSRLEAYIANLSDIEEKALSSLIKIDETNLDYSYLKMNANGDFYLIIKSSNAPLLEEITTKLEAKYEKIKSVNYEDYKIYVANGDANILLTTDLNICQFN